MTEHELIAETAVCKSCGKPNLIWLSWLEIFKCGYCKREYTFGNAAKLRGLTEMEHWEILRRRFLKKERSDR